VELGGVRIKITKLPLTYQRGFTSRSSSLVIKDKKVLAIFEKNIDE